MSKVPIFIKMLLPIVSVMIVQSAIVGLFLVISGTMASIRSNAINLVVTSTEFRSANFQDSMVRYWSSLGSLEAQAKADLRAFLDENEITLDEFLGNRTHEIDWLYEFSDNVMDALFTSTSTGIFIYFLDGICPSYGGERRLNGLYVQNFATLPQIRDNIMFLVGHYRTARRLDIPQEGRWAEVFTFKPEYYGMWRGFAYPQFAAQANPNAPAEDLSFWNPSHVFWPSTPAAYAQMTYSRPVFFEDRMIAIIGTEIRFSTVQERLMPVRDFGYIGESGYVLTLGNVDGNTREIVYTAGIFANTLLNNISEVTLLPTPRQGVYNLAELPDIYMVYLPLNLYNDTSYFASYQWALAAISTEEALFSVSNNLVNMVVTGILVAIVVGAVFAFITVKRITQPIGLITRQLMEKGGGETIEYKPTSLEIDLLCETMNEVTKQRISAENQTKKERQRYLLALESSTDAFIEYKIATDELSIFYFDSTPQKVPKRKTIQEFSKNATEIIHPDDAVAILLPGTSEVRVRADLVDFIHAAPLVDGIYYWASLKIIESFDDNNNLIKLIGTAREITAEKERQLAEEEAKRRDITSGFYNLDYGLANLKDLAAEERNIKILRIENFNELEFSHGLVFGGFFIAEFSSMLQDLLPNEDDFAIRINNDSFLLVHEKTEKLSKEIIQSAFAQIYTGNEDSLHLSVDDIAADFTQLRRHAKYNPVKIFLEMGNKEALSNIAMELFERSTHISNAAEALLRLVGRLFELKRIVVYNTELAAERLVFEWDCPAAKCEDALPDMKTFATYDSEKHTRRFEFEPLKDALTRDDKAILHTLVKITSAYLEMQRTRFESKAKSNFLSRVSHEIRTPMNAIMGITDIAKSAVESQDIAHISTCLDKIGVSANHLFEIINDVLEMSRIESGKVLVIDSKPFNLEKLINETDAIIRFSIEHDGIEFIVNRSFTNSKVMGDGQRIKQVLINLLGNANKFTNPGGTITLDVTESRAGLYTFCVSDTGIGIPFAKQPVIFDAFEQAETPESSRKGTGLGLSISRSIIRAMGSDISLKSEPGVGSIFTFTVELATGEQAEEVSNTIDYSRFFAGKRALLVDDSEINLEVATFILEFGGFEVETAFNGLEAVEKFRENPAGYFDVILMDIQMPVMGGMEATTRIRTMPERSESIPIVALTADAFDEDSNKSVNSGMNGHVAKPINRDELFGLLQNLLF